MPTYEVFLKKDGKDEYRHAGALEAANEDLAMTLARECYVRRAEGDRIWLVDRTHVIEPEEDFLTTNADKPHRHHSGEAVAARRKAARTAASAPADPSADTPADTQSESTSA